MTDGRDWRRILFGRDAFSTATGASTDPAADLRKAMSDLESDLTETEKQLADAVAEVSACHTRAVAFVQEGKDIEARNALVDKGAAQALRDRLDADAAVLRAMIDECRAVLETSQSAKPNDLG